MKTAFSTGALALIVGAAAPAAAQVVTEPNSTQPTTQTAPPVTTDTSVQPPASSSTMPSTTMPSATTGPSSTYNSTTGQSTTTTGPGSAYNSTTGQPTTNPSTTQTYPSTTGQNPTTPSTTTAPSSSYPSMTTGQPTTDTTTAPPSTYPSTTTTTDQSTTTTTAGTMDQTTGQTTTDRSTTTSTTDGATSADGTPAFGIEPYFGILGGYHLFDRPSPIDGVRQRRLDGALIEGVIGVNIPVGPVFVGVEGHGARGFGDLRWEYGVRGRAGFRAGESGLVYASAGYTWTNVLNRRGFPDREGWMWGIGAEFGPSDVGLGGVTGRAGPRFRISVETADFNSIRPMAGVIFHF